MRAGMKVMTVSIFRAGLNSPGLFRNIPLNAHYVIHEPPAIVTTVRKIPEFVPLARTRLVRWNSRISVRILCPFLSTFRRKSVRGRLS